MKINGPTNDYTKFMLEFISAYKECEINKKSYDIYVENIISSTKPHLPKNKPKLILSGENMYNGIRISNVLFKLVPFLFNKWYSLIPKVILNIPIQRPYKKYLKILDKENYYFILCNDINKKNVLSIPYFMYKYESEFKDKLLEKKNISNTSSKRKFCAFIVSNPANIDRLDLYQKLSKYKQIDSYGKVFRNMPETDWSKHTQNYKIFEEYKFVICYENSYAKKYITEKLPVAMMGNVIPIYRGAEDVDTYFNPKSFLNRDKCSSDKELIEKIIELDQDDSKYLQMLSEPWFKNNEEPTSILDTKEEIKEFLSIIKKGEV